MTDDARDRARASALDASSSSSSRPWTLAVASRAHVAAVKSVDVARARADGATTVVSASADGDALARRRRGATWEPLARLRGHDGGARATCAGRARDRVLTASYDRTARVWTLPRDARDACEATRARAAAVVTLRGHGDYVTGCAWSEDENFGELATTASADGTVRVWRAETGECLKVVDAREDGVGGVTCVDARATTDAPGTASDDCVVVAGLADGSIRFFHVRTGACALILVGHLGAVTGVATPDAPGTWMESAKARTRVCYGCRDGAVGCFDVSSEGGGQSVDVTHLMRRRTHPDADLEATTSVKFILSDARTLASSSEDGTVRMWNVQRGECTMLLTGQTAGASIDCVSMLDDVLVSGGSDGSVSIWEKKPRASTAESEREDADADDEATLRTRADIALRWLLRLGPQIRVDEVDEVEECLLIAAFDAADREARALLAVRPLADDRECGVCRDSLAAVGELAQLPCSHIFHADCLLPWMRVSHQCPLCREVNYESGVSHALACVRVFAPARRPVTRDSGAVSTKLTTPTS